MTGSHQNTPIQTLHLFPVLDQLLIGLLKSLSKDEWNMATIAKQWTVKDIAAHLLDGNLKTLSFSRDHYFGVEAPEVNSFPELVSYLNESNATWVKAAKRLSPEVLIELLEMSAPAFVKQLESLDPFDTAIFPVAWAGQDESVNWFHIAREYTEKFIHQQQIREAVDRQALFTRELFYPFIDTLMYALPPTYRKIAAETGTTICLNVLTEIGGSWMLVKESSDWQLTKEISGSPAAVINITPGTAWKLFSKGITPAVALNSVTITGNNALGEVALQMVAVMAS